MNGHVSGLAGGGAAPEFPSQNQAATNAGTQRHHRHVLASPARAKAELAHGGTVRIVAQDHRHIPVPPEEGYDGHIPHGEVGGEDDVPAGDGAWQAHAHTGQFFPGRSAAPGHALRQRSRCFCKLLRSLEVQRHPLHRQDLSRLVHQAGL